MNFIIRIFSDLLSLLFPNVCCGCGIHLNGSEKDICSICLYFIPYTDHHIYPNNKVAKQFWGRIPFNAAMALLHFKKGTRVQNIIHSLKYKGQTGAGIKLGTLIAERLQQSALYNNIDVVIPVPLHKSKERSRGYNQSRFIAEGIAVKLKIPLVSNVLIRNFATESQTKKKRFIRYENMNNAFGVLKPEIIFGKHVLLIDDVITTGATIEACASELYKCGIGKLSIVAAAFAE